MEFQQCGACLPRTRTVAEVLLMENQYPPLFVASYIHPSEQQPNAVVDTNSGVTVFADAMESLHSFNFLGLELRSTADAQWLSDRPDEAV